MMPWPIIPMRRGRGLCEDVPSITKLSPSLRFPLSFLFPPCVGEEEGAVWIVLCGLLLNGFGVICVAFD